MWVATTLAPGGGGHGQVVGVAEPADVVAEHRAGAVGLLGHRGPPGVDRDRHVEAGRQDRDGTDDAVELLILGDLWPRAGLHPPDVEEVGPIDDQLLGPLAQRVEVVGEPLVVERVRRAVEDAHHEGPMGQVVGPVPELELDHQNSRVDSALR
jgi:hypothetical protein